MIESLMLCGIGLLAGCLLMLLFFPAVHQRAVRLTRRDLVDANVTQMIAPARQRLALAGKGVGTLALHFRFFKIGGAIIAKERLMPDRRQLIFAPFVSLDFERFSCGR